MLKSLDMVLKMDIETAAEPSSTDPAYINSREKRSLNSQNKLFLKGKQKKKKKTNRAFQCKQSP